MDSVGRESLPTCSGHVVTPLVVRTVFASQPMAMMTIPISPQAALKAKNTARIHTFQPELLEKTRCINKITEHFARLRARIARISDAKNDRPATAHDFSSVTLLNLDRPFPRPWKMAPAWPTHTTCTMIEPRVEYGEVKADSLSQSPANSHPLHRAPT
jgi:hypothetical protein